MTTGTAGNDDLVSDPTLSVEAIDALGGDDIVSITIGPNDQRTITVDGGSGLDTLSVFWWNVFLDLSTVTATGGSFRFRTGSIAGTPIYSYVIYEAFEKLELAADLSNESPALIVTGSTDDLVDIQAAGWFTAVEIETGAGSDRIFVSNWGDGSIDAGPGDDSLDISGLQLEWPHKRGMSLYGGAGNDTLIGSDYRDTLEGGPGADRMEGGARDDAYYVDDPGDVVVERALGGKDSVSSSISYTLPAEVENLYLLGTAPINGTGNAAANEIRGNSAANILDGGEGADRLFGGDGNDIYYVDRLDVATEVSAAGGIDTVFSTATYTLGPNLERLTLIGDAAINGFGNALDNILTGNSATNLLDGGAGADWMTGGDGDDTYVIDDLRDRVFETSAAGGIDTVQTPFTFALAEHFENLKLLGSNAVDGIGNALDNVITGNAGANQLNGREGADRMIGGDGDDIYYVDNVGDRTVEVSATGGTDTVRSSVSFALEVNVENLTLTGAAAIDGTGNKLDNLIVGNAAANVLVGGAGADLMKGGDGDDTYYVDDPGDRVVETSATGGIDGVRSSVSFILGPFVENLMLTGSAAINGTGNELDNVIVGNSADNVLDGRGGADIMRGGSGNDTYYVNHAGDQVIETSLSGGTDSVFSFATFTLGAFVEHLKLVGSKANNGYGNDLANTITGNTADNVLAGAGGADMMNGGPGNDRLYGGLGNDHLHGGSGLDGFYFDTALDAAENVDAILDFSVADDTIFLDRSIFTNIEASGDLDAAAFRAGIAAADGDDRIIYDQATGNVWYDADGTGAAEQILFAQVVAGTPLTAADFVGYI